MRAITIDTYKTRPHLQEMPKPQPGAGEILIRLHTTGVNPMDWKASADFSRSISRFLSRSLSILEAWNQ